MEIIVPEAILLNSIKSILRFIKNDHIAHSADYTKSFLYRAFKAKTLDNKYQYYEQAVEIFTNTDKSRALDVNLFFNMQRAKMPTIHITLPSETQEPGGIGVDQGYNEDEIDDQGNFRVVYSRKFASQYNLVITSNNSNETILIYHFLRAMLIPLMANFNVTGLENLRLNGGDLQNLPMMPPDAFIRVIGLAFSYDVNATDLYDQQLISSLIFSTNMLGDIEVTADESQSISS